MINKNSYKGYAYQKWVISCFVQKMDLFKEIKQINAEIKVDDNFDDIYLETKNKKFYCQVKNYENANIDTVKINENSIKFKNYKAINYDSKKNNILILNKDFETNTEILGIKARLINSIYFIPLTENNEKLQIGQYIDINRKDNIQTIVDNKTNNGHFKIKLSDLPKLNTYSIKLNEDTIKLNELKEIKKGVKWIVGEPGIGKSHLVTEYEKDGALSWETYFENTG